jgi:hypothetical protein
LWAKAGFRDGTTRLVCSAFLPRMMSTDRARRTKSFNDCQTPSRLVDDARQHDERGRLQLAAEEAELAKAAITNEGRANYALAAYYTRLVEANEKLANAREVQTREASTDAKACTDERVMTQHPLALR